eukprot:8713476-Alexandrium_andersonii.AAC.1
MPVSRCVFRASRAAQSTPAARAWGLPGRLALSRVAVAAVPGVAALNLPGGCGPAGFGHGVG